MIQTKDKESFIIESPFSTMNIFCKILLVLLLPVLSQAQLTHIDSLNNVLKNAPDGPLRYKAASNVYFYYQELNRDSALHYADLLLQIAQRNHHMIAEGVALVNASYQLSGLGNFGESLKRLQSALVIAENIQTEKEKPWDLFPTPFAGNSRLLLLSFTHHMYGILMLSVGSTEQQISHFKEAGRIGKEINYFPRIMLANLNLGQCYLRKNRPDSALFFEKEAESAILQIDFKTYYANTFLGTVELRLGDIYNVLGKPDSALQYYYKSLRTSASINSNNTLSWVCLRLNKYHLAAGNKDSALYYSLKNLHVLQTLGSVATAETNLGTGYENVYLSYQLNKQFDSAYKYMELALITKDSLNRVSIRNFAEFQNLNFSEQLRLQNLEREKVAYQNKIRMWFLLAGIGVLLLLAIIFYRNNLQKNKAKIKIEQAYDHLKATQQQLIQSEKMASLGELTAGIAHEIQNPLNFVNNFSDINKELLGELKDEIRKGNVNEVEAIAEDVISNEEKINHHGKRADAIVKGMLQHSRNSTGQKESTDINALTDEYLRLAYHGLRAKDKAFNATLKTEYDENVGSIKIIPQDIGRVILNLITNAFYVVDEKSRSVNDDPSKDKYEPTVSVSTKKINNKVEISVRDNGSGIPQKVLDKIFQPFFTTKPTGQGTGLGLSLSYDIVKAHGGELKVETKEGEGSVFVVQLPVI